MSQMHNTHLDVLSSYGIVVFLMFLKVLNSVINKINIIATNKMQKACIFAFYSIIFMGTFEAALVSGGTGLYILSGSFLLLAKFSGNKTDLK